MTECPCGTGARYASCCAPLHSGAPADSPEALMRSRYSAFALGLGDYLLSSWHPSTRPHAVELEANVKWLGLRVEASHVTGVNTATVDFVARWRQGGGRAQRQVECSRFVCEDGRWFYLDAQP